MDKKELWENTLAALELEISKANFAAFLSKTSLSSLSEREAVISCPNSLIAERLRKKYSGQIQTVLADLTGKRYQITFEIRQRQAPPPKPAELGPLFSRPEVTDGLFPAYTFDNFVVGPSNQFAHAAALSVASQPGGLHNPLLFYAGVGLGKTHLMQAIGNAIKRRDPKVKIRYCSAESFTNEMITAIQDRRTATQFKKRFRSVDLLMIDDIQFLAGREATQEEFFNTFNALYLSGKQIVLTSDRHPQEIKKLEERLVSRFSGGTVADIQPPDLDLRIAILKQKAKERGMTLNEKVIFTLAERIVGNIRQLEGTLNQLLLLLETHQKVSPEELLKLISQSNCSPSISATPKVIINAVCQQFGVTTKELTGIQRTKEIALPRQMAMYLLREISALSLAKIGSLLGGRDHSTVLYGIQTVKEMAKKDPGLKSHIEAIKAKVTP